MCKLGHACKGGMWYHVDGGYSYESSSGVCYVCVADTRLFQER